jgi:GNAT superfamily N-acetyltransferase
MKPHFNAVKQMTNQRLSIFTESLDIQKDIYDPLIKKLCAKHGFLQMTHTGQGFLVFDAEDDELIAYILYHTMPVSPSSSDEELHVDRLFVAPEYRKRGLAKHLLNTMQFTNPKATSVVLTSTFGSMPFWTHMGYSLVNAENIVFAKMLDAKQLKK